MSNQNNRSDIDYEAALADLDFPHPRDECVASVVAAHRLLQERGRATRTDFVEELEPAENHSIGLAGAQMRRIGEIDGYHTWWWEEVIEPGLRALPDVNEPDEETSYWEISESSQTEQPGDEPSAKELIRDLKTQARQNPEAVNLSELEPILADPATPPGLQLEGVDILRRVAKARPNIGVPFVDELTQLLNRPSISDTEPVVKCLYELAKNDPEAVMPAAEALIKHATTEPTTDTKYALNCCTELVQIDSIRFVGIAPKAGALLSCENKECRKHAIYLLQKIAEHDPEDVIPFIDEIASNIEEQPTNYQINALIALGRVSPYADEVKPIVETATSLLEASNEKVKANALGVLADVSTEYPGEVMEMRSMIGELLDDEDDHVRINATSVLLNIAIEYPDPCLDTLDPLIEALDDRHPAVRRNSCKALGHIGSMEAYDDLQAKSVSDQKAGVRNVADWAMRQIL